MELANINSQYLSSNFFAHAPIGMAVFEARPPYRITSCNSAYLRSWPTELQTAGLLGRSFLDCLQEPERQTAQAFFEEVIQVQRSKTLYEFHRLCPQRGPTWWNWSLTPVCEEGTPGVLVHMLMDVTDSVRTREEMDRLMKERAAELEKTREGLEKQVARRRRAQHILRYHMELHRKILDNIPVMLIVYDQKGRTVLFNREFRKLTGWRPEEIRRMDEPMNAFYPDPALRQKAAESMLEPSAEWKEFPIATRAGELLYSLWTHVRLSDGSKIGIGLDMRQRLETERKLETLNRDLNRRAEQLHFLAAEVTEAEDRERRHLAEMLHDDLQQMLVAAKYQLNFIREGIGENAALREDVQELQRILNQSIAKTRGLSHELSPPALHQESLAHAMTVLAQQMKEKHGLNIEVETRDDYKSPLDNIKSFLFKAVQEMLFNIIKHAGTHRAQVRLWQSGLQFNVRVSDQGKGFDPVQLEQWTGSQSGMGIFKMQERVRLMGGTCQIASSPGNGTSITLSLPIRIVPKRTKKFQIVDRPDTGRSLPPGSHRHGSERKLRVVLADDHDVVRKGIAALLLKESDIEIVGQASNGQQAVELARQLHPDLILMDVAMPMLDGVEATRILQKEIPDIKIIALSMFDKKDMAEHMLQAGAMMYLNKSDAFEELLGAIRKVMGIDSTAVL